MFVGVFIVWWCLKYKYFEMEDPDYTGPASVILTDNFAFLYPMVEPDDLSFNNQQAYHIRAPL